jgi:hypothetical protein
MTVSKIAPTWYANIWIAGDYAAAVQACREYCRDNPLCVTVTPTVYVYTGGAQDGVCVRLINYPRFPSDSLEGAAKDLADDLRYTLCQDSYTIEYADQSVWYSNREEPCKADIWCDPLSASDEATVSL